MAMSPLLLVVVEQTEEALKDAIRLVRPGSAIISSKRDVSFRILPPSLPAYIM